MTEDEYYREFEKLAEQHNVGLTETAQRLAKFRERTQLSMDRCPCEAHNKERGCISPLCLKEIQEYGSCHCNCFCKK